MVMAQGSSGKKYTPAPAGTHQAVCVDVVDLGVIEKTWQGKTRRQQCVQFRFQILATNPENGKRFMVSSARFNNTLGEKAALRQFVTQWLGRQLTEDEVTNGFDLDEMFMGRNAILTVIHAEKNGETYANISAVIPLMQGMGDMDPEPGYVRQKDRPKDDSGVSFSEERGLQSAAERSIAEQEGEEPLPF